MLAIIGGTGLYDLAGMEIEARHTDDTPFGTPSDPLVKRTTPTSDFGFWVLDFGLNSWPSKAANLAALLMFRRTSSR